MGLFPPVDADRVPALLLGVSLLVLAAFIVLLDARSRLHRALGLLLFMVGAYRGIFAVTQSGDDVHRYWDDLRPYFEIAIPFAALNFARLHRLRYVLGSEAASPLRFALFGWALVAGVVAAEAMYAADHSFYQDPDAWGPFYSFEPLAQLTLAVVALVFVRDYTRSASTGARRSLLLAAVAFGTFPLYASATYLVDRGLLLVFYWGSPFVPSLTDPLFLTRALLYALTAATVAWAAIRLVRAPSAAGDAHDAARAPPTLLVPGTLLLAALLFDTYTGYYPEFGLPAWPPSRGARLAIVRFSFAFFGLFLPGLLAYAVVRHRLFDIDVRLRWALDRGTLAGIFVGVFFVVAQLLQNKLNQDYGWALGGVAAGLLLFALGPLERFASRVSGTVLPPAKPLETLTERERAAIYREQVELAWLDGRIERRERFLLDNLRKRLGLAAETASRLEDEALRHWAARRGAPARAGGSVVPAAKSS